MDITESKSYLKSLSAFRMYEKYIDNTLAGDFACDLTKELKAKQERIDALKVELEYWVSQHECNCNHHSCKACDDTVSTYQVLYPESS